MADDTNVLCVADNLDHDTFELQQSDDQVPGRAAQRPSVRVHQVERVERPSFTTSSSPGLMNSRIAASSSRPARLLPLLLTDDFAAYRLEARLLSRVILVEGGNAGVTDTGHWGTFV
jgi:hypothetical protein